MSLMNIDKEAEILTQPCQEISLENLKSHRSYYAAMFDYMLKIMRENNGIGLAANQAGFPVRACIVAVTKTPTFMVNPRITFLSGEGNYALEGCLSCPGEQVTVRRSNSITVEYYNLDGVKQKLRAVGLTARCIQHEVDHLDGYTIRDHVGDKLKRVPRVTISKKD